MFDDAQITLQKQLYFEEACSKTTGDVTTCHLLGRKLLHHKWFLNRSLQNTMVFVRLFAHHRKFVGFYNVMCRLNLYQFVYAILHIAYVLYMIEL